MSQAERVRERLQAIDERLTRLRTEKDRLVARVNKAERRRQTRQKIVIGGTVLAAVEHEGLPTLRTKAELLQWLEGRLTRSQDRTVFGLSTRRSA